jgi:hypothetical protein
MRTLIRLGVLVLAALGAKGLWEKYGPRLQRAKRAGADWSGRVKSSAVEVGTKVGGVAQRIGGTTHAGNGDSKYSALEKAEEVSAAADAARDHAAHAPATSDTGLAGDHELDHTRTTPRS